MAAPAPLLHRGPLLMVLAELSFTLMIAAVKVARDELSPAELIFWRSAVVLPTTAFLVRRHGFRLTNRRVLVLRAILGFVAMIAFYTAARGLALADLSLIGKLRPILIALTAGVLLGQAERATGRIWGSLLVGLTGCALIVGPELSVGASAGLWALLAALASAGAHMCLRILGRTDHPSVQVFYFQVLLVPLALLAVGVTQAGLPRLPSLAMAPYVVAVGLFATAGQLLLTKAYSMDTAARVAGAAYTGPLWAALLDVVVFAVYPSWTAVAGGALVVGAGLALTLSRRGA